MKVRDLVSMLSKLDPDLEVSVPCGHGADGEALYTEKIIPQPMESPEAVGIDPDGTPQTEDVLMVMLLPGDGPWAEAWIAAEVAEEEEEENEEDDSESWKHK